MIVMKRDVKMQPSGIDDSRVTRLPWAGRCRKSFLAAMSWRFTACLALLLLPLMLSAVRVIEEEAIPFAGFLSKAEFDQRYPGEQVEDLSQLDPGWYVIYEHESLSYYFGPILLKSTGEDYLAQLEEIVEKAVAQRPSIQGYRLELSYEPSEPDSSAAAQNEDAAESSSGQTGSPPPPPPKPSIWGFIKRLFGF